MPRRKGWDKSSLTYLTQEELKRFFVSIKGRHEKRDKCLFHLMYRFGLRVSEAVSLRWEDIDFLRGRIQIRRSKNGIGGEYPLAADTLRLLKSYRKQSESPFLFPLDRSRVFQIFRDAAQKAGLPEAKQHPHCLRHSIAVHLLDAGAEFLFVRNHLGHRRMDGTLVYARYSDKKRDSEYRRLDGSPFIV